MTGALYAVVKLLAARVSASRRLVKTANFNFMEKPFKVRNRKNDKIRRAVKHAAVNFKTNYTGGYSAIRLGL